MLPTTTGASAGAEAALLDSTGSPLRLPPAVEPPAAPTPGALTQSVAGARTGDLPRPESPTKLPDKLGPYRVLGRVGAGGMGIVFRGHDDVLDRPVALKVLARARGDDSRLAEVEREARSIAAVAHPHVVQVYSAGEQDGLSYFAMELVQGPDLREVLEREGPLAPPRARRYMTQAAAGLRAAARKGIFHRDVKPGNLLLDSAEDTIKVADFGLARRACVDASLGGTSLIAGTPLYVAPEVIKDGAGDQRADIYSLGATFFHLLAGQPLFGGASAADALVGHALKPAPLVTSVRPGVPLELEGILARCLEKDPAARFADYDQLLQALDPARAPSESGDLTAVAAVGALAGPGVAPGLRVTVTPVATAPARPTPVASTSLRPTPGAAAPSVRESVYTPPPGRAPAPSEMQLRWQRTFARPPRTRSLLGARFPRGSGVAMLVVAGVTVLGLRHSNRHASGTAAARAHAYDDEAASERAAAERAAVRARERARANESRGAPGRRADQPSVAPGSAGGRSRTGQARSDASGAGAQPAPEVSVGLRRLYPDSIDPELAHLAAVVRTCATGPAGSIFEPQTVEAAAASLENDERDAFPLTPVCRSSGLRVAVIGPSTNPQAIVAWHVHDARARTVVYVDAGGVEHMTTLLNFVHWLRERAEAEHEGWPALVDKLLPFLPRDARDRELATIDGYYDRSARQRRR